MGKFKYFIPNFLPKLKKKKSAQIINVVKAGINGAILKWSQGSHSRKMAVYILLLEPLECLYWTK